jgi:hypothetical protein
MTQEIGTALEGNLLRKINLKNGADKCMENILSKVNRLM